jgi:hypothetical protein
MSYDLGVRGDYEGLYSWLDARNAKECGDSLAVLKFEYRNSLPDELRAEINRSVTTDKRTRIYVVYRDNTTGHNKGTFLIGGRRASPWLGHAPSSVGMTDEE